jgi:hypothetical protein
MGGLGMTVRRSRGNATTAASSVTAPGRMTAQSAYQATRWMQARVSTAMLGAKRALAQTPTAALAAKKALSSSSTAVSLATPPVETAQAQAAPHAQTASRTPPFMTPRAQTRGFAAVTYQTCVTPGR